MNESEDPGRMLGSGVTGKFSEPTLYHPTPVPGLECEPRDSLSAVFGSASQSGVVQVSLSDNNDFHGHMGSQPRPTARRGIAKRKTPILAKARTVLLRD